MKLELKGDEMMVVKEEVESIQVKGGISKEPVIVFTPGQTLGIHILVRIIQFINIVTLESSKGHGFKGYIQYSCKT